MNKIKELETKITNLYKEMDELEQLKKEYPERAGEFQLKKEKKLCQIILTRLEKEDLTK